MCCDETKVSGPAPFQVGVASFAAVSEGYNLQVEVSDFKGEYDWYGIVFVVGLLNGKVLEIISAKYREGKPYQSSEKVTHTAQFSFNDEVVSVMALPEFALAVDGSVWGNEKALSRCMLMMKQYERRGK